MGHYNKETQNSIACVAIYRSGQLPLQPRVSRPPKPTRRTLSRSTTSTIVKVRHPQSSKHGIVLFLGEENSGKSSTLNFLLGNGEEEISPVGHRRDQTGTTAILEFRSRGPVDNLRIIDTPGLGFPDNLEWDAQVMASLKKFMDTDIELSCCIPHAVVLVTRFDQSESDFGHPNSSFVKTLKAISLLKARLLDEHNSNLIVVLTRFMHGKRRYRIVPQPHLDRVKQLVRFYLDIPYDPYLVPAENEASAWNLAKTRSSMGDSFQLSSGDSYPKNLIDAFLETSKTSKSLISFDYFRFVLQNRQQIVFKPLSVIEMVDPRRKRYRKFLEALIYSASSSTNIYLMESVPSSRV